MLIKFNNTYTKLPEDFYKRVKPVTVKDPKLIHFNTQLADDMNIDYIDTDTKQMAEIFSGNKILPGSQPIALAYAGHQFGHFVPKLGDGRAILLGEITNKEGYQLDIQLKGSGITPYSRDGDGRAALGPAIREYVISNAMHALGIKTTRSLAIVTTGEFISRNGKMLQGAVLTRIAASHIRIGTFEYFASRGDFKSLKILADYTINRHYPQIKSSNNPYISLLECVQKAQISLIVDWMRVGFIHGVMNTDNVALSGETLDYGPCAFIDEYNPNKVFSFIDKYGRYRFNNQANICNWNIAQLAMSLAPLIDNKSIHSLHDLLYSFNEVYEEQYLKIMSKKIGIINPRTEDLVIINELLDIIYKDQADYTLTFRYLSDIVCNKNCDEISSHDLKIWIKKWYIRLQEQNISQEQISDIMLKTNPAVIPRNHKLEEVINYAIDNEDFSKMNMLIEVLADPYNVTKKENNIEYIKAPLPSERVSQTFCGT